MAAQLVTGFDYRRRQSVAFPRREWRWIIDELKAGGGRVVRHRRVRSGDDDLLLIKNGRIIAEVYDSE
jgi:hypothetical protein